MHRLQWGRKIFSVSGVCTLKRNQTGGSAGFVVVVFWGGGGGCSPHSSTCSWAGFTVRVSIDSASEVTPFYYSYIYYRQQACSRNHTRYSNPSMSTWHMQCSTYADFKVLRCARHLFVRDCFFLQPSNHSIAVQKYLHFTAAHSILGLWLISVYFQALRNSWDCTCFSVSFPSCSVYILHDVVKLQSLFPQSIPLLLPPTWDFSSSESWVMFGDIFLQSADC